MIRKFFQAHRFTIERFDQVLLGNPVLERGLVIAPIIVTCQTLQNALALSLAFCVITVLTVSLTFFIPKKIAYTFRVIANAVAASLLFIPAVLLLERIFPESIFHLGIYLPLLVTNSLIVQKSESRYHRQKFPVMLAQLAAASLGFALAASLVGGIREILSRGTLLGKELSFMNFTVPAVALPFAGFLIAGFLAAGIKKFRNFLYTPVKEKRKGERHE